MQVIPIELRAGKKIYFSSDNHLGAPNAHQSRVREVLFVRWLDRIQTDAQAIFLLGDLFDFWFCYDKVVPKGFVRILGKLAELVDKGISVYFFVGNHDLWEKDYLHTEVGLTTFFSPQVFSIAGKTFFVGHGDGLGPGDEGYKRMKRVFTNRYCRWLFKWLHPDLGVRLAQYLSLENKLISGQDDHNFLGDGEHLVQYCKEQLSKQHYDFFVFGHRHLPLEIQIGKHSHYINTGDWINYYTYAQFDGVDMLLLQEPYYHLPYKKVN